MNRNSIASIENAIQLNGQETGSEPEHVRKLEYRIEGRIDTTKLHTKPRKKFAEDGRLKAFGSGGRRRIAMVPCCSKHKSTSDEVHGSPI